MRDQLPELQRWLAEEKPCCAATVIETWGSAPRPVGSTMFIGAGLEMLGSVSGGCIEGALLREAKKLSEYPTGKTLRFGVADNDAWAVGLTCGGAIEIFMERFFALDEPVLWRQLQECLLQNRSCVLLTDISDGGRGHIVVEPDRTPPGTTARQAELFELALRAYRERRSQVLEVGGQRWFAQVFARKPQLLIIGAAHAAAELVQLAAYLGFETIVIDPRETFARQTHFPTPPDRLLVEYPAEVLPGFALDEYAFAVLMAHDPKIDDQALHLLLRSDIAYIGALSSKRSNEQRRERLLHAGFTETDIGRIHAPVGLPIRSKTAREIALSIAAQLVAVKNQFL
ncbi:MAG: XdhC family protein [Saprospirales bacterium]|nr:XdhC family protein [Saprospirales bacterium]MBK8924114.1 XdhC family protein [Saprospirales bacterium]